MNLFPLNFYFIFEVFFFCLWFDLHHVWSYLWPKCNMYPWVDPINKLQNNILSCIKTIFRAYRFLFLHNSAKLVLRFASNYLSILKSLYLDIDNTSKDGFSDLWSWWKNIETQELVQKEQRCCKIISKPRLHFLLKDEH